jgi:hypothetical protein
LPAAGSRKAPVPTRNCEILRCSSTKTQAANTSRAAPVRSPYASDPGPTKAGSLYGAVGSAQSSGLRMPRCPRSGQRRSAWQGIRVWACQSSRKVRHHFPSGRPQGVRIVGAILGPRAKERIDGHVSGFASAYLEHAMLYRKIGVSRDDVDVVGLVPPSDRLPRSPQFACCEKESG